MVNLHKSPLQALRSSLATTVESDNRGGEEATNGMRFKFLYDMAYSSSLERFPSFLKTDLGIMPKPRIPIVMFIKMTGR
jgi:hypothetical protein